MTVRMKARGPVRVLLGAALCALCMSAIADAPQRLVPDNLFHVRFVDESRAWITGYHGTVLRSDDGGASWTHMSLESDELIRRGAFPSRDSAFLVGHRGSIFQTADAGGSWRLSHREPDIYLRDIAFLDERRGWAVGHEGIILHTADGGQSWSRQAIGDWKKRDLPRLSGVTVLDEQRIVATGEFGVMAWTTDGGRNWTHLLLPGSPSMTAIASQGGQVLAVGLDGAVAAAQFAGGGLQARRLPLEIPTHLLDVRMTRQGVLVSGFGVVVHCLSLDSCAVQDTTEAFPSNFLWLAGVDLAADGSVWAVGLAGHVGRADSVSGAMDSAFVLGGRGWSSYRAKGAS